MITRLMCGEVEVLEYDFENFYLKVFNKCLIPYQLRGMLKECSMGMYDMGTCMKVNYANEMSISEFYSRRVLTIDRVNAKKVLNALNLDQRQDVFTRRKIAEFCRIVSLEDNYWIKRADDNISWSDVNIRQNRLSNVLAQVALHGVNATLNGKIPKGISSPELTTQGSYAKCWKREDGKLWLYKASTRGNCESEVEVEVSKVLDKSNVPHVRYFDAEDNGVYCCKCMCMTSDKTSRLDGLEYLGYCDRVGVSPNSILKSKEMYQMHIIDYLVSNTDRHGQNWGLFYNSYDCSLEGCHPLYDHNNAFDKSVMGTRDGGASLFYRSRLEVAVMCSRRVNVVFKEKVTRKDFKYKVHYDSFRERCSILGIRS